jgi:tRNA pseudouridine55 synthase
VPIRGLLNLNKPSGITSRGAIDLVCRLAGKTKVGHAGTLDPLASGVLVVGVGAATRLIEYVQRMPKHYTATFLLGRQSETEDIESLVVELDDPPIPTREEIVAATGRFCGRIQQRPPAYSAVKVAGRRAYALARAGREVELDARPITVHRLEVRAYAYPTLTLEVRCGGGTYVRSLGRDLAASLGTAAVMSELVRTAIGGFRIEQSVDPAQLTAANWADHLQPPLCAVQSLPRVELSEEERVEIGHGRTIPARAGQPDAPEYAAIDSAGRLVAILRPRGPGLLGPLRNLT